MSDLTDHGLTDGQLDEARAETPLHRIARFDRDLVVQAGAGTGKTHALVTLYLHLLGGLIESRRRTPPGRILVVTFTDKAAGELKERIRTRVAALAGHKRGLPRAEVTLIDAAKSLGGKPLAAAAWADILGQLGQAPIGTFHAFAGGLLRRHAARLAIDPEFELLDAAEADARSGEAAERAVLDALEKNDQAVAELVAEYGFHGSGRAWGLVELLVALRARRAEEGRGSGFIAHNYARAVLDEELQSATHSFRDAWRALGDVADELGGKSVSRARELSQIALGRSDWHAHLEEATDLVKQIGVLRPQKGQADGRLAEIKESVRSAHARLIEANAGFRAAPHAEAVTGLVESIERRYAAAKQKIGAVDFTDLLVLSRNLLRDHADIRHEMQARFDAVLVDEFQDTNPVQAELVELIGGASGSSERSGGRLFVVGDRKQSIYEFRGADVGVFVRCADQLVERGGAREYLKVSYRSASPLLRLTNALFARAMPPRATRSDFAIEFVPAHDDLETTIERKSSLSESAQGQIGAELITVAATDSASTRRREARAIAGRIAGLQTGGIPYGGMAILLRQFTHLQDYLTALRGAQIPYFVVRGRGFFGAQEVRDIASALTLLSDPDDRLALVSVLRSPLVGLSDEGLARLSLDQLLQSSTLLKKDLALDQIALGPTDLDRLTKFRAQFRELRAVADRLGPVGATTAIMSGCDFLTVMAGMPDGEQRVANLERLIDHARKFEATGGELRAFSAWLRRVVERGGEADAAQAQVVDERDDVVRVMTVHQSKGLEFPVVFVAGCGSIEQREGSAIVYDSNEGLGLRIYDESQGERVHTAASRRVLEARRQRQHAESLRLFYVAATRARELLIFSGERGRRGASWRAEIEGLIASPEGAALLRVVDGDQLPSPRKRAQQMDLPTVEAITAADRLSAVTERAPAVTHDLTVAVTQLAEFDICPRRYLQFHALGLQEHSTTSRRITVAPTDRSLDDESPLATSLDPLRRGTLAHRLLQRCELFRGGADLDDLLTSDGYDLKDPSVIEVRGHVARFLATKFARGLSGAATRRELPFLLALPIGERGTVYLRGQIDLLLLESDGVTILDYKHARAGAAAEYQFQLDAYSLAAHRLYPKAPQIRQGLVFLKERTPEPLMVPSSPLADVEARLVRLGGELQRARAAEQWVGRPVEYCREIGCGYVYHCHPREIAGAQPTT